MEKSVFRSFICPCFYSGKIFCHHYHVVNNVKFMHRFLYTKSLASFVLNFGRTWNFPNRTRTKDLHTVKNAFNTRAYIYRWYLSRRPSSYLIPFFQFLFLSLSLYRCLCACIPLYIFMHMQTVVPLFHEYT